MKLEISSPTAFDQEKVQPYDVRSVQQAFRSFYICKLVDLTNVIHVDSTSAPAHALLVRKLVSTEPPAPDLGQELKEIGEGKEEKEEKQEEEEEK